MDFIGNKKVFLLAPMAGFTNSTCRSIFREFGADAVVSEFVHARAVLSGSSRVLEKLAFDAACRPVGIQLFGGDPSEMADAAQFVAEKLAPDFVDVNFGCPAPNAVDAGAGSALLRDVPKMARIMRAVSDAVKIPATAKMRTGWGRESVVLPDAARELEQAGAQMLAIHGRTKIQGYGGDSDWGLIESTARTLSIPVIGNGSAEKLSGEFMRSSACAGFMIGRAALGNPWIFRRMKARLDGGDEAAFEPSARERAAMALRYARAMAVGGYSDINADNIKFIETQVMRFLKNAAGFKRLRVRLKNVKTIRELEDLLCDYL